MSTGTPYRPACSPLTDQHCDALDLALQGCSIQDELLGLCKQAGLTGLEKLANDNERNKQLASGIKATFFPDRQ